MRPFSNYIELGRGAIPREQPQETDHPPLAKQGKSNQGQVANQDMDLHEDKDVHKIFRPIRHQLKP